METKQINRITMFKTVSLYLGQNNSVWSSMPQMVTAVEEFENTLTAIDEAAQKQDIPTSGITGDKSATRDALEDVLFLTSEALGVLGHTTEDRTLSALVKLSASALEQMSAEELSTRAQNVLAEATARATDLARMNVTQANIQELDQTLQAFNAAREEPRTATVARAVHRETLGTLSRQAASLLRNQIDPLVNLFRRTNPDFVAGYRGARVTVDRAATHRTKTAETQPPTQ